jgi:formylglycine-generating enzyme required for sulfatase activity
MSRPRVPTETPTTITNTIGMKLVLIPAGEFLMGSPDSDTDADANEKPRHRVQITKPFYLGATEVTQGQYRAVTGANPSNFQGSDDLPVENVSWVDAQAFCAKLNELERGKLSSASYRLPTEAEWKYACRAGTTTRFSFGDADASLGEYGWFAGNSDGKTHPVGQKRPNAWGLFDMHGNAWEWCWADANSTDLDGLASAHGATGFGIIDYIVIGALGADPSGPLEAADWVSRGGSWNYDSQSCRAACRVRFAPGPQGQRFHDLGFRLARVWSSQ